MPGTVIGTWRLNGGQPDRGAVVLQPSVPRVRTAGGSPSRSGAISAKLDENGSVHIPVELCTDDVTSDPTGVTYSVTLHLSQGVVGPVVGVVINDAATVDLNGVIPVDPQAPQYAAQVTAGEFDELAALVADLIENGPGGGVTETRVGELIDVAVDEVSDSFAQKWVPSTVVPAGSVREAPTGETIKRIANGTTRAAYDATEAGLWTVMTGPVGPAGLAGPRGPRSAPTVISTRALGRSITTTSVVATETSRTAHTFVEDATGIRVLVTGWGNGEASQPDLTVRAALEYGGVVTPFTFDGQQTATVPGGSYRLSDPLGVNITAGSTGWLRGERTVTGGAAVTATTALRATLGEGTATAASAVYGPASGFTTVADENAPAWAPLAILADGAAGRSVAFLGDSMANAQRDTVPEDGGFMLRAVTPDVGVLRLNGGGGTVADFVGNSTSASSGRRRLALAQHASHAWVEYGANDLNGGASLATIQANLVRLWKALDALGLRVWQSTITPWSSSTDGWATVENQTPYSAHATRIALNDWIRTTPAPLAGYFEVADVVESSRNSGRWALTGVAPAATDGIHPSTATYAKIATAIRPVVLSALTAPARYAGAPGAQGPVGNPGTNGTNGTNGAPGSVTVWDEQVFTPGAGTWTKPAGAVYSDAFVCGAGAGGASGRRGAVGTARSGGGGGAGGVSASRIFSASVLPATVPVTVPAGTPGAAAPTADDSNGVAGTLPEGPASFGSFLVSGSASQAAQPGTAAAVSGAGANSSGMIGGGNGGAVATAGGVGGNSTASGQGTTGGGAGGGITAANVASPGGQAAKIHAYGMTAALPADVATNTPAQAGTSLANNIPGTGGGGGSAGGDAVTGKGADGAIPGGGGGAGAGHTNGAVGGAGGKGGDGVVIIRTLCIRPAA